MAPAGSPGLRPAGRLPGGRWRAAAEGWRPCRRGLASRQGDPEGTRRGLRPLRATGLKAEAGHAARAAPAACLGVA